MEPILLRTKNEARNNYNAGIKRMQLSGIKNFIQDKLKEIQEW